MKKKIIIMCFFQFAISAFGAMKIELENSRENDAALSFSFEEKCGIESLGDVLHKDDFSQAVAYLSSFTIIEELDEEGKETGVINIQPDKIPNIYRNNKYTHQIYSNKDEPLSMLDNYTAEFTISEQDYVTNDVWNDTYDKWEIGIKSYDEKLNRNASISAMFQGTSRQGLKLNNGEIKYQEGNQIKILPETYKEGDIIKMIKRDRYLYFYINDEVIAIEPVFEQYRANYFIYLTNPTSGKIQKLEKKECPIDGNFAFKITDPNYRFRGEYTRPYKNILKNIVDSEGNLCPEEICGTKSETVNQISDGNYFFHLGLDGDNRFYNNANDIGDEFDVVTLDKELTSFKIILKNNNDKQKTRYLIKAENLPGTEITYRRTAYIDSEKSKDASENIGILAGPMATLSKNADGFFIDLYKGEIVTLTIDFIANYNSQQKDNKYDLIITDTDSNESIAKQVSIEVLDKEIPEVYLPIQGFGYNGDDERYDNPIMRKLVDYGGVNIRTYNGVNIYTRNNSITGDLEDVGFIDLEPIKFYLENNIPVALYNPFINQHENNLTYLTDAWINAYVINMKLIIEEISKTYPEYDINNNIILYLVDEVSKGKGSIEDLVNFYSTVRKELPSCKIHSTFGNKTDKEILEALLPLIDIAQPSWDQYNIEHKNIFLNWVKADEENRELWIYDSQLFSYDLRERRGVQLAFNDYIKGGYSSYFFHEKRGSDWNGKNRGGALFYNMIHYNGSTSQNILNHWNPNGDTYVPNITWYARVKAVNTSKIIKYLKSLNNSVVNDRLKEYEKIVNETYYSPDNIKLEKFNKFENDLRRLYLISKETTSSSARKVEKVDEEKSIFTELISFVVVYPNPTAGEVNVKAEKEIKQWKLVNISGRVINSGIFGEGQHSFTTNVSNYSGNLFILQLGYVDGSSESKKIMKK